MEFLKKIKEITEDRIKRDAPRYRALQANRRPLDCVSHFKDSCSIIAEIKYASPSAGAIRALCDPCVIAKEYIDAAATMLSVLTESQYFEGSVEYLKAIRDKFPEIPLLMKDFFVDVLQLYEALDAGADAVLLIVAMLDKETFCFLYYKAQALGLSVLVEVHTAEEFEFAIDQGCKFIGVNNRNLKTLEVGLNTARTLASLKQEGVTLICESGITNAEQVVEMSSKGFDGFLIGSHFMKQESPGEALRKLLKEACHVEG